MEKIASVLAFQCIGNIHINPLSNKPLYQSSEFVFKRNYFVVQDKNLAGFTVFLYYPITIDIVSNRLFIHKFPVHLLDGIILFGKSQGISVLGSEVSRGRIIITDRIESFDVIKERVSENLTKPDLKIIPDILLDISVLEYTLNPSQYWVPYEKPTGIKETL